MVKKSTTKAITQSSAKIITKSDCPYCIKAKALLKAKGISYKEVDRADVKDFPYKTVPQIWIDNEYIGGYTELAKNFEEHDEASKYKECAACEG